MHGNTDRWRNEGGDHEAVPNRRPRCRYHRACRRPVLHIGARSARPLDEADTVSLTLKPHGDAVIAYRKLDSYPYPTEGSVKIAYESTATFSDRFEAGDTSGSSTAVP